MYFQKWFKLSLVDSNVADLQLANLLLDVLECLNPKRCMSASNWGSRATRGKIRMAVFPSSDNILVSIQN